MDTNFFQLYKHGMYYCPANKHYGFAGTVNCDRCQKTGLTACIGYKDMDACLSCAADLDKEFRNRLDVPIVPPVPHSNPFPDPIVPLPGPGIHPIIPPDRPRPDPDDPGIITRMMPSDYPTRPLTRMMPSDFGVRMKMRLRDYFKDKK